jgi:hypothetical protein
MLHVMTLRRFTRRDHTGEKPVKNRLMFPWKKTPVWALALCIFAPGLIVLGVD